MNQRRAYLAMIRHWWNQADQKHSDGNTNEAIALLLTVTDGLLTALEDSSVERATP